MTIQMAIKQLREELHLQQKELAKLLELNITTVNRWETGKAMPSRTVGKYLLTVAKEQGASELCLSNIEDALFPKVDTEEKPNDLRYTDIDAINQMVNDSVNGVVVIDLFTYDILYVNTKVIEMLGVPLEQAKNMKCYEFLLHGKSPCSFCTKKNRHNEEISKTVYTSKFSKRTYIVNSKMIKWSGRDALIKYITDVTDLQIAQNVDSTKKNNEKVSETELEKISNHIPGALVVFSVKNQLLWLKYISESCVNITGFTADETYQRSGADPLRDAHPDSREFFQNNEWNDIQKREKLTYHYQLMCKDGSYKWVILELTPVEEDDEINYYGILRDSRVEERIEEQKESTYYQLLSLMERTDEENLIAKGQYDLTTNRLLKYIDCNHMGIELPEDPTFDEARERLALLAARKDKRDEIHDFFNRTNLMKEFEEGRCAGKIEFRRYENRGTYYWSCMEYEMCKEPFTGHMLFFCFSYDISKSILEKSMLKILGETEYDVMGTIDVGTGYYETQGVGAKQKVLDKTHRLAKGKYQEIWHTIVNDYVKEEERESLIEQMDLETVKENLNQYLLYSVMYTMTDWDGKTCRKKMTYCYLDDEKETIFYYRSDISAIYVKEQEQMKKIEEALQLAESANKSKTEFLSRISHDMRTPLNGILGVAELMKDKKDIDEIHTDIEHITLSGQYLLRLINDTLDMNRIEEGRLSIKKEPVKCKEVFQNVVLQSQILANERNINFMVDSGNAEGEEWTVILSDQERLEQILMNVISNAIKYTPEGGTVEFQRRIIENDGKALLDRFVITDNGIGMSKEFIPHLFEPFTQEERMSATRQNGTGLGMSIVKQVIELMGGTIQVNSVVNEGTQIVIEIPFELSSGNDEAREKFNYDVSVLDGKRVLLCEDHPLNQKIAVAMLEKVGMTVVVQENGFEGLKSFEKQEVGYYNVILMDVRMPIMDGIEATQRIRRSHKADAKSIPIIAMTANAFEDDERECKEAGMDAHIPKPYQTELLYETIANNIK